MTTCTNLCTKEECQALSRRIEALETALQVLQFEFREHRAEDIPRAHKYNPNVKVEMTYYGGATIFRILTSVSVDDSGDEGFIDIPTEELKGEKGEQGPQGERGEQGPQGEKGKQGPQGEKGEQGPQGERGEQGPQGERGEQGPQGERGEQGERGYDGLPGLQGEQGERGFPGGAGPKGEQGEQGPKGDKGDPGQDSDPALIIAIQADIENLKNQLGDGSMSLNDLNNKLDDILSKIENCCQTVTASSDGIRDLGLASQSIGDAVTNITTAISNFLIPSAQAAEVNSRDAKEGIRDLINFPPNTATLGDCEETTDQDGNKRHAYNPNKIIQQYSSVKDLQRITLYYLDIINKHLCELNDKEFKDERIWHLLGGDSIFTADAQGNIEQIDFFPETEIKQDTFWFSEEVTQGERGRLKVASLPRWIRGLLATEYYRNGHDEYPYQLIPDLTASIEEIKEALNIPAETEFNWGDLTEAQEEQLTTFKVETDKDYERWYFNQWANTVGKIPLKFTIKKDHPLIQDIDLISINWTEIGAVPPIFGGDTLNPGVKYRMVANDAPNDLDIEISSLSDGIVEILGLVVTTMTDAKLTRELVTRIMYEIGSLKQLSVTEFSKIEAIQSYLGAEFKEVSGEYDLMFTPDPSSEESDNQVIEMLSFLQPAKMKYIRDIFVRGKFDTLESKLRDILHSAMIIRARYWQQVKPDSVLNPDENDTKNKHKDIIGKAIGLSLELLGDDQDTPTEDNPQKTKFDDYLKEVEEGFRHTVGDIDQDGNLKDPYGRNYDERPKIQRFKGEVKDN